MLKFLLPLMVLAGLAIWFLRKNKRGAVPEVGTTAPYFDLPDSDNHRHRLTDYCGRWLVLYFYPRDATPVCTAEACNLRDSGTDFKARNVTVLGVSLNDAASHNEFAKRHGLPFPLLSDLNGDVARAYGSLWDLGVFRAAKRHTFLIDPASRIAKVYCNVTAETQAQKILADLDRLAANIELVAPASGANNQSIPRNS